MDYSKIELMPNRNLNETSWISPVQGNATRQVTMNNHRLTKPGLLRDFSVLMFVSLKPTIDVFELIVD